MRRIKTIRFFLVGLLIISCGHVTPVPNLEKEYSEENYPKRVIDAHSHFSLEDDSGASQPTIEMLKMYREANVLGAVIHFPRNLEKSNRIKVDRARSDFKMALCAAIVPGQDIEKVEAGLKNKDYRCMKVYLGYVSKYAADPFYIPFYRLAEKYEVPVVFHTGDTYDKKAKIKYAEPLQVDEIALQFPKVNFVIAHMGNPWIQTAAEVVYKNDNVYVDISALMLGDVSKASPEALEELAIKPIHWFWLYVENPKKMMFGSDWPLMEVKPYVKAVMRAIPEQHWDDVFYLNAATLFKLDSSKQIIKTK